MKLTDMTIEEMCTTIEKQSFDRKSAKIEATAIATPMIAFANADGGLLAVGIEDNGEITGIDDYTKNINEILRAGYDFCQPSIFIEKETIDCIDKNGNANHILLIKIPQSADMHVNHRDEAFLRVGDKSKKLTFDERMELMYSKGMRFYEDEPVYRSTLDDIDMDFVAKYCEKIGYGKTPEEYIKQNKDYIVNVAGRQEMSGAAIKMFDDHMTVESPGTLPGTVRLNNMREIHFSRNPKMAQLLHEYEYVREFGEGVDRMYREMEEAGLPEPEYKTVAFMVHATIKNKKYLVDAPSAGLMHQEQPKSAEDENLDERTKQIIDFCKVPRRREEIMSYVGLVNREHFRKKILKPLLESGKLEMTDKEHPKSKNQKYVSKK